MPEKGIHRGGAEDVEDLHLFFSLRPLRLCGESLSMWLQPVDGFLGFFALVHKSLSGAQG